MFDQKIFEKETLDAIKEFLNTIFNVKDYKSNLSISAQEEVEYEFAIFLGVYGNIEGAFILELRNETAKNFIDTINEKLKLQIDFKELIKGYIGELGNVLFSKFVFKLDKKFGDSFISTPSIIHGQSIKVDLFYENVYKVNINTDFGIFGVTLCFKD